MEEIKKLLQERNKEISIKDEEIGRLKEQLIAARSSSAAVLVRDTLTDFRKRILIPEYLSPTAKDPTTIRQGYMSFFEDENNQLAVRMKEQMRASSITEDVFVDSVMKAYTTMNRIIHTCSNAFKTLHSLDDYLIALREVPRLDNIQKKCVELVAANIPF